MRYKLVYLLLLIVTPVVAQASALIYNFSGTINDIRDFGNGNAVVSHFSMGDHFFGSLAYDSYSPFVRNIEPNRDLFSGPSDPFLANINGINVSGNINQLQLFDNYPYDMVFISSNVFVIPDDLRAGTDRVVLRFQLRDNSGLAINDMKLPNSLELDAYTAQRHFGLTGYKSDGSFAWHIAGDIDSLHNSAVPEPSSWAMMIIGFGLIGGLKRSSLGQMRMVQRYTL